jgi:hypothetical protein
MSPGVVLVRSARPEAQLQALRTALSLSLGDRPADLLVEAGGRGVLEPARGSDADHALQTLRLTSTLVALEAGTGPAGHASAEVLSHDAFVERLAGAEFVQVF